MDSLNGTYWAGRAAPRDFPRAKPKGNPEEQQDKNSVLSLLNGKDGSVWSLLKFTDGSVWTHLNNKYRSYLRFPTQSSPTRFPQSGNSVDYCYYARKATKLPFGNRMLGKNRQTFFFFSIPGETKLT